MHNSRKVKPTGIELVDRLVAVNRVTKVNKGGRTFSFSAIVVVGDENGTAGYGTGKSKEVSEAIAKAVEDAKKNLYRIPLLKVLSLTKRMVSSLDHVYSFVLRQAVLE